MNLDLNKLTCGVSLTDTEQAVLEYLLLHLDEALKLGVRGVAKANFTSTSTVMRLSRKLGYNGFIEMYYKLLGAVGEGNQSYELNEGFISHFAGEGAVSMENYRSLRLAAEKIYQTDQVVFIYGMGFSSMMAEYLAKSCWYWESSAFFLMGLIPLESLRIIWRISAFLSFFPDRAVLPMCSTV